MNADQHAAGDGRAPAPSLGDLVIFRLCLCHRVEGWSCRACGYDNDLFLETGSISISVYIVDGFLIRSYTLSTRNAYLLYLPNWYGNDIYSHCIHRIKTICTS